MLDLSNTMLSLASGGSRVVYQHPVDPTSIVKIHRRHNGIRHKLSHSLHPSHRRFGPFRNIYDEYKHYVLALYRHGHCPEYMPEFRGFVDTTLGIGQVFEKVSDDGCSDLAPTLKGILASGDFDAARLAEEVRTFFAAIKEDRIVFRDLTTRNLCVVHDADGEITRIVAIDGLGDFTLIPLRSYFQSAYDRWHVKAERKILAAIEAADTA